MEIDKEVIIDGVNVAGCKRFTTEQPHLGITCLDSLVLSPKCEDNPDCYFKQLQRLRAENEELKKKLERYKLYQEVEEFIEKYSEDKGKPTISYKLFRYKQALERVKEKAQENDEMLQGYHHEWANNKLILDIINEVLND
ncbi:MAG: hypothetical protein K2F57_03740 [Candidatus Gastranaerophilales bacterium]|nr:hypothetical protein [Candidatus Gastranaerophilales bacterium]